jgi:hypothetical protein
VDPARRRLAAGLAGLLGLAACGNPPPAAPPTARPTTTHPVPTTTPVGPGPTPTESVVTGPMTPTPTGTALRLSDDQAAKLLISAGDLPTAYQVDPAVSPDVRVALPPGCAPLDAFGAALRTAPVRAARGFVGGPVYPFLEERVAVLPDAAADQLAQFGRALVACHTFDSRDPDGVRTRFTTGALAALETTDHIAISLSGRPVAGTADPVISQVVVVSRGDVLVMFVLSGLGKLDTDVLSAAAQRASTILDGF